MSVYIKGMEMPKCCATCPMLEGDRMDGLCHAENRWLDDDEYWTWYVYPEGDVDDSKPCNCPLVPVSPHGRLIDGDVAEVISFTDEDAWGGDFADGVMYAVDFISEMPTIIPAEEGE